MSDSLDETLLLSSFSREIRDAVIRADVQALTVWFDGADEPGDAATKMLLHTATDEYTKDAAETCLVAVPPRRARLEVMRLCLARGANVNCCDSHMSTALHHVASHWGVDAVGLLLDAGAAIDAQNMRTRDGSTALCWAACRNRCAVIRCLLRRGADTTLARVPDDGSGRDFKPEVLACRHGCVEATALLAAVRVAGGWRAYVRRSQNLSLKPPISLRSALFGLIL